MAKINGIQIKNLKTFKDHEGAPCCQGDIWYNGKKLGFWSQDSWGGPDMYHFDESVLDAEVKKYAASDRVEPKYKDLTDLGIVLCDLLSLMDQEKAYKKCVKAGYKTYVEASDGFHVNGYYCMIPSRKAIENGAYHKKFIENCKEKFFKDWDGTCNIFTSLDDFVVSV